MTYVKPAIVDLGTASASIQGAGDKLIQRVPDANPNASMFSTGGSYDLDE